MKGFHKTRHFQRFFLNLIICNPYSLWDRNRDIVYFSIFFSFLTSNYFSYSRRRIYQYNEDDIWFKLWFRSIFQPTWIHINMESKIIQFTDKLIISKKSSLLFWFKADPCIKNDRDTCIPFLIGPSLLSSNSLFAEQ